MCVRNRLAFMANRKGAGTDFLHAENLPDSGSR
jgi:hypothetical protein